MWRGASTLLGWHNTSSLLHAYFLAGRGGTMKTPFLPSRLSEAWEALCLGAPKLPALPSAALLPSDLT